MNDREARVRKRLRDDFNHYASKCLKIRTKSGSVIPLDLNAAQSLIHARLEEQLATTGRVRALILKGRQQGSSTYTEGRFYWRVTWRKGCRAFILTHEDAATQNLFKMAERYHQHCPDLVKPHTGASNAKELYFDNLDSGYGVGTARTKGTGRSDTIQYFHGSEVAYWPNAAEHMAGIMQAVPDEAGTEIILESTSAGAQGEFYRLCKEAMAGQGEYILIFVPWFVQQEYRKPTRDFVRTSEEEAYGSAHGLDDEQLAWRREKIRQFGSVHTFRREYPATPAEAFAMEVPGALWTRLVLDETRVDVTPPMARVVIAVDPPGGATECGIAVCGMSAAGHGYIVEDRSIAAPPEIWSARVVAAAVEYGAAAIVAEKNYGGDMVGSVITTAWRNVHGENTTPPLKYITAKQSKQARAEPVSILWTETGGARCHMVGRHIALEDELCTWVPHTGQESPNRLDAAVHGLTELMLGHRTEAVPIDNDALSMPSRHR